MEVNNDQWPIHMFNSDTNRIYYNTKSSEEKNKSTNRFITFSDDGNR